MLVIFVSNTTNNISSNQIPISKCVIEIDLIQLQFPIKQQARHSNYVAETFNYFAIVAIMLTGLK